MTVDEPYHLRHHTTRMRPRSAFLFIGWVFSAAAAREIPQTPQPVAEKDEPGILAALEISRDRLSGLRGFRFPHQDALLAMATVTDEILAPDLVTGREILCRKTSIGWRCRPDRGIPLLFASLPPGCPDVGRPTRDRGPVMRILRSDHPSPDQIRAILVLICQSESIGQAWRAGHRLAHLRRNADGQLEIATQAPSGTSWGLIYVIVVDCGSGGCRATIVGRSSWTT